MRQLPLPPVSKETLILVGLVFANLILGLLVPSSLSTQPSEVWKGPAMPGKPLELAPPPDWVTAWTQAALKVESAKPDAPSPTLPEVTAAYLPQTTARSYEVHAGSFVLDVGAETLMERLKTFGLESRLVPSRELVSFNNVQAGPFKSLEEAKEAEIKVRAAGIETQVEETWEGYVLSLGKFFLLEYAISTMDEARKLKVEPLRIIRMEADKTVHRLVLGPFSSHEQAKEVSARVSELGLAIPVIRETAEPRFLQETDASAPATGEKRKQAESVR